MGYDLAQDLSMASSTLSWRPVAVAACVLIAGCATAHRTPPPSAPSIGTAASTSSDTSDGSECPAVPEAYVRALADARTPTAGEISRDLLAIAPETEGLRWSERGQVLMVTWAKPKYFRYQPGEAFALHGDTFFTAVPEVQEWCREFADRHPDGLVYRLHQLLGLPPPAPGDDERAMVELWIDPRSFFRPCPDPEIFDHECLIRVPLVGHGPLQPADDRPPWLCPRPSAPQQVAGAFVQVNVDHLRWMCDRWQSSYGDACPARRYPWTALGYTYDWGSPDDPRGPSEFVAPGHTEVVFHSLTSTEEYCGAR